MGSPHPSIDMARCSVLRENHGCCFGLGCGIMVWWGWLAITAITFLVLLVWSPRALSPKRLVVKLLDGYRRVNAFRQWLRGTTATEEVERRVISGQAWADFCDTLKAAGAAINAAGTPTDAYTQAEGYRCVLKGWIVVCAAVVRLTVVAGAAQVPVSPCAWRFGAVRGER